MSSTIQGVEIQAVAFGAGQIEVTYAEERDMNSPTGIIEYRTMVIPHDMIHEALADLMDSVLQVLDTAQVAKRNPKAT